MASESLQIRTVRKSIAAVVAVSVFSFIYILFSLLITGRFFIFSPILSVIMIIVALVASNYLSSRFSGSDTTFTIENGNLIIDLQTDYFNFPYYRVIPLNQIAAYEIPYSRKWQSLIIYMADQAPEIIGMTQDFTEKHNLLSFLSEHNIRYLSRPETRSGLSYKAVFIKSLLTILSGVGIFCIGYSLELFFLYPKYNFTKLSVENLGLALIIVYQITKQFRRKYRAAVDFTWIFMGTVMSIIIFYAPDNLDEFTQKPGYIKEVTDINAQPDQKFFYIRNFSCDTTLTGYYKRYDSNGRRSITYSVVHYFTSPILTGNDDTMSLNHRYWVAKDYRQQISKMISASEQNSTRLGFMNQKAHEFNLTASTHASFYEIVYSDLNPNFSIRNYLNAVGSTSRIARPLIIVSPHKESFEEYKKSNIWRSLLLVGGLAIALSINAILIASYR